MTLTDVISKDPSSCGIENESDEGKAGTRRAVRSADLAMTDTVSMN
jgi:hypothetical protein